MEHLDHPNVMPLIGVCVDSAKGIFIIMPLMKNGSLLEYLRKERSRLKLTACSEQVCLQFLPKFRFRCK